MANVRARTFPRTPAFWFMIFLIWVAFALRVIRLNDLPLELSLDESTDGLDALRLVREGWLTPFLQNNFGRETLFLYLQGALLRIIGVSVFALRFASVLIGTLTVPLMYVIGCQLATMIAPPSSRLTRTLTGCLAATGMAVCYWHLFFSRQALRAISLLPLLLIIVWLIGRAHQRLQRDRQCCRGYLALSGLLLGLSQYTYLAARLLPGLFIPITLIWLIRNFRSPMTRRRSVDWAMFWLAAAVVTMPLIAYFISHPYAFSSRAEAISLPEDALWSTLVTNLSQLLLIQFGSGIWLGQWPSLSPLFGIPILIGVAVCLRNLRRDTAWFTLVWLVLGWSPVLLSRQNWDATTTILRGIVAWPVLCLLAALGITTVVTFLFSQLNRKGMPLLHDHSDRTWMIPSLLLLALGGTTTSVQYFGIWASEHDVHGSYAPALIQHLNQRVEQPVLCPRKLCGNPTSMFLLQAKYPVLSSLLPEQVPTSLDTNIVDIVLPREDGQDAPLNWYLLAPKPNDNGNIILLPPLSRELAGTLAVSTRDYTPRVIMTAAEDQPTVYLYTLKRDIVHLWAQLPLLQPIEVHWKDELALISYAVQPTLIRRGQDTAIYLVWKALRAVEGDYDLFIHLYHQESERRIGQVNKALGDSLLLYSQIWPPNLCLVEVYHFTVPSDAPEGVYRFELGLYHRASLIRLPVAIGDQWSVTDSVILGKLRVYDTPPPRPTVELSADFEDNISLLGLDLVNPITSNILSITLHWRARDFVPYDYTVFVHLIDGQGNLVFQQDNMPQHGHYPTSWWDPGELVLDTYLLGPFPELPSGRYGLRIGLYDLTTGRRLQLLGQEKDYVQVPLQRLNGGFFLVDR